MYLYDVDMYYEDRYAIPDEDYYSGRDYDCYYEDYEDAFDDED